MANTQSGGQPYQGSTATLSVVFGEVGVGGGDAGTVSSGVTVTLLSPAVVSNCRICLPKCSATALAIWTTFASG